MCYVSTLVLTSGTAVSRKVIKIHKRSKLKVGDMLGKIPLMVSLTSDICALQVYGGYFSIIKLRVDEHLRLIIILFNVVRQFKLHN